MKLIPYKFEVVAICHVVDDDGKVNAEQALGRSNPDNSLLPVTLFSVDGLVEWAEGFEEQLDKLSNDTLTPTGL